MDEFGELALREREARRIVRRQWFWLHFVIWAAIQAFLVVVWALSGAGYPWFVYPLCGWGIFVAGHAAYAFIVRDPEEIMAERDPTAKPVETPASSVADFDQGARSRWRPVRSRN